MRRNVQILAWTLIWSGVFIFGYLGWQLFGTDVVNAAVQAEAHEELEQAFENTEDVLPEVEEIDPAVYLGEDPGETQGLVEFYSEEEPETGDAIAFIRIDKIGVDEVIFEGDAADPLVRKRLADFFERFLERWPADVQHVDEQLRELPDKRFVVGVEVDDVQVRFTPSAFAAVSMSLSPLPESPISTIVPSARVGTNLLA